MQPLSRSNALNRSSLSLSIALALALSAGVSQAATSAQGSQAGPSQELEQSTVHHLGWDDPKIAVMVERTGQALVDVLERADQALAGQSPALASNNLAYADNLAQAIGLQAPYVEVKDRLETAKGKLEAGATHDFVDDLAPVYAGIDNLILVAPETASQLKGKVKQAEALAKAGKGTEAVTQVDEVVDNIAATGVYIPVAYVQGEIDSARKALAAQDIDGARKDVQKALSSLQVYVTGDTATGTLEIPAPKSAR